MAIIETWLHTLVTALDPTKTNDSDLFLFLIPELILYELFPICACVCV